MTKFYCITSALIIAVLSIKCSTKPKATPPHEDKIASLSADDIMLKIYMDTAQSQLPYLIEFMAEHDKDDSLFRYAVKTNFTEDGHNEHMWVQVYDFKNGYFTGTLSNDPSTVTKVKYGDTIKINRAAVEDWILQDFFTHTEVGGFSQDYLRRKSK